MLYAVCSRLLDLGDSSSSSSFPASRPRDAATRLAVDRIIARLNGYDGWVAVTSENSASVLLV